MNLKVPEYIRIAQLNSRELDVPGTLLRLDPDEVDGYTHGIVVDVEDDGRVVILPGNSRSEVLTADGEHVGIYIFPDQLEHIGAAYDGRIGQMPRVVSKDAQTDPPKKLPYDPEQPGHYLYVEKPISEAPPGAAPVDEGSIPQVLYERTLPQGGPEINQLRQTLDDAAKMSRALAVHIADAEDMRKQVQEFATLVNAAQDVMRRNEERSRQQYRDPSGRVLQQPEKRTKDMYVALSMMDKIRSGLETSGLFLVQYRNVIYQLKIHSDVVQRFMVSKQGDQMMRFRDWMLTYNEFANAWSREAIARNKTFVDAKGALRKAWQRYRAKHSIFLRRELTRYGKRRAQHKPVESWKPGDHVWSVHGGREFIINDVYQANPHYPLSWKVLAKPVDDPEALKSSFSYDLLTTVPPQFKVGEDVLYNGRLATVEKPFLFTNQREWRYEIIYDDSVQLGPIESRVVVVRGVNLVPYRHDPSSGEETIIAKREAQNTGVPPEQWSEGDVIWSKWNGTRLTVKDTWRETLDGHPVWMVLYETQSGEENEEDASIFTTKGPQYEHGTKVIVETNKGLQPGVVSDAMTDSTGVWQYEITWEDNTLFGMAFGWTEADKIHLPHEVNDPTSGEETIIAKRTAQSDFQVGDVVWSTEDHFPDPKSGERGVIKSIEHDYEDSPDKDDYAIVKFPSIETPVSLDFITKEKPPVENGQKAWYVDSRYTGAPRELVEVVAVLHGFSGTWEAARVSGKKSSFFNSGSDEIIHHQVSVDDLQPYDGDPMQGEETVIAKREASILDEPRATLNPSIFDLSTDPQAPKMWPEVRQAVLDQLAKLELPEDAIKSVLFFGSAAAYQYEETSDFDVTVVVDEGKTDMSGLMRDISDELFIAKHPVTYFLRTNEYPVDGSDAIYDLRGDFWIRVPEVSEGAIHKEEYQDTVEDAIDWAKKLDLMIGETRRDYIDYEKLELAYKHVKPEKRAEVYDRIKRKLSELQEGVAAFANEADKLHQTRAKAFAEDLEQNGEEIVQKYLSRNWLPENVLYKILERYQYTKVLKAFDKINDKRMEGEEWVDEVKQLKRSRRKAIIARKVKAVEQDQEVLIHRHQCKQIEGKRGICKGERGGKLRVAASGPLPFLLLSKDQCRYVVAQPDGEIGLPIGTDVWRSHSNPSAEGGEGGVHGVITKKEIIEDSWTRSRDPVYTIQYDDGKEERASNAHAVWRRPKFKKGQSVGFIGEPDIPPGKIIDLHHTSYGMVSKPGWYYQVYWSDEGEYYTHHEDDLILFDLDTDMGESEEIVVAKRQAQQEPKFQVGQTVYNKSQEIGSAAIGAGSELLIKHAPATSNGRYVVEVINNKGFIFEGTTSIHERALVSQPPRFQSGQVAWNYERAENAEDTRNETVKILRIVGWNEKYNEWAYMVTDDLEETSMFGGFPRGESDLNPEGPQAEEVVVAKRQAQFKFSEGDLIWVSFSNWPEPVPGKIKHVLDDGGFSQKLYYVEFDLPEDSPLVKARVVDERIISPRHGDDLQSEEIVIAQKQTSEFNATDWLSETETALDDFVQSIEELKDMYASDLMYLERLEEHQAQAEQQGAGVQTDPAIVTPVAATLKTGQEVYHLTSYRPDGEIQDAEPLIVKASTMVSLDAQSVTVIDPSGKLKKVSRGRLVTAQSEIRPRRRKRKLKIEDPEETNLEELIGKPKGQPKLKPSKPHKLKLKPTRKDVPPGMVPVDAEPEEVGAEPVERQQYEVEGEPVPVIQPPQLVQDDPPPKPAQPAPSVPTPDELEEVRFDDIPEAEWRKMSLSERIRLAAVYNRIMAMEYEKITPPETGVQKTYIVEPYSYRVKRPQRTGGTPVWYLFAFDVQDNHIKAFIVRNIRGIEILDQTYSPRWDVEFFPSSAWQKFRENRRPQQPEPDEGVTFVTTPFEA